MIETGKDVKTARIGEMSRAPCSAAAYCRLLCRRGIKPQSGLDSQVQLDDSAMIRSSEYFEIVFLGLRDREGLFFGT